MVTVKKTKIDLEVGIMNQTPQEMQRKMCSPSRFLAQFSWMQNVLEKLTLHTPLTVLLPGKCVAGVLL